jgi:hypothetical protein
MSRYYAAAREHTKAGSNAELAHRERGKFGLAIFQPNWDHLVDGTKFFRSLLRIHLECPRSGHRICAVAPEIGQIADFAWRSCVEEIEGII